MAESWRPLVDALLERNLVKRRALESALRRHRPTAETVERVLVDARLVTRGQLLALKAELHHTPSVDLQDTPLDPEAVRLLPQAMAERYQAVCYKRQGDTLLLAAVAPLDAIAIDYLRMRTGFDIQVCVSYAHDIEYLRETAYVTPSTAVQPPLVAPPALAPTPRIAVLNRINPVTEVAPTIGGERRRVSVPGLSTAEQRHEAPSQPLEGRVHRVVAPAAERCAMCRNNEVLVGRTDERAALQRIMEAALQRVGSEAISLLMLEADGKSLFFKHALGGGADEIRDMVVPLDEASVAGWVLANGEATMVHDAAADPFHNKETDRMIGFSTRSLLAAPVLWGDTVLGVMEAVNKRSGHFTDADLEIVQVAAHQASVVLYEARVTHSLNAAMMETVDMLVELLEAHGTVSRAHLMNVAQLSTALGREAGLDDTTLEHLSYAGLLHDIGMSRTLAGDTRDHPGKGAEMLERIPMLRHLVGYVGFHHERWDGEGTYGLRGDRIPLGARILAVAEAWCEEQPWDETAALRAYQREFLGRFGTAFDPELKEPFVRALETTHQLRPQG